MEKKSLYEFTNRPLLKNDVQLKKSYKQSTKKRQSPKIILKKSCPKKSKKKKKRRKSRPVNPKKTKGKKKKNKMEDAVKLSTYPEFKIEFNTLSSMSITSRKISCQKEKKKKKRH